MFLTHVNVYALKIDVFVSCIYISNNVRNKPRISIFAVPRLEALVGLVMNNEVKHISDKKQSKTTEYFDLNIIYVSYNFYNHSNLIKL